MSLNQQEDEVVEQDPSGRYYRYNESVGRGRFKSVFKGFDTSQGIDVAWSKICGSGNQQLTEHQLAAVAKDISKGLELEHDNIIRCYKCWEDHEHGCINLITELFTSGNLRQYRNAHKHLDLKAIKRMGKQILRGLHYLHSRGIYHSDLRIEKIYVNGHSGEVKIGDLGLATLQPYRWQQDGGGPASSSSPIATFDAAADIYAFGLCMLELLTLKQLDPQACPDVAELLAEVADEDWRAFVGSCLAPAPQRPSAEQLLSDPFLAPPPKKPSAPQSISSELNSSTKSLADTLEKRRTDDANSSSMVEQETGAPIGVAVGKLKGEDYSFEFHGKVKDGKMHIRLVMTDAGSVEAGADNAQPFMRTIDFTFDPEVETADILAADLSETFELSPTDTEICAAALKEWLAREMPGR